MAKYTFFPGENNALLHQCFDFINYFRFIHRSPCIIELRQPQNFEIKGSNVKRKVGLLQAKTAILWKYKKNK